jgi:hypothetical protein
MIDEMANAGDDAIIGWAFDGFPIYGHNNPDGSAIVAGVLEVGKGQAAATSAAVWPARTQATICSRL